MKFTFKKDSNISISKTYPDTIVKLQKKQVGYIVRERDSGDWVIRLQLAQTPTKNAPSPFKWIALKQKFSNEPAARDFLNQYFKQITERYTLHPLDMD